MKKCFTLITALILAIIPFVTYANSNEDNDEIRIFINGELMEFNVMPQMVGDRVMVPMRAIFEALGAEVRWDDGIITATTSQGIIQMEVGSDTIYIYGRQDRMDVSPIVVGEGTTLVPARFVAQAMGQFVMWLSAERTVIIGELTSDFDDSRYLELVNLEHFIRTPINNELIVTVSPTVSVRTRDITLHISALYAVAQMFDAATNEGVSHFFVSSGYRTFAEQAALFNSENNIDGSVLPPNHSEHQLGLAADILVRDISMHHQHEWPQGRWLAANSWRFGLIQRYPAGKEHITSVPFEPWHFRYVGNIHAWFMFENNMVLEEYLQFLQQSGGYTAEIDGRSYIVLYQRQIGGRLHIPHYGQGLGLNNFNVSSDNMGGYIVTSWIDN